MKNDYGALAKNIRDIVQQAKMLQTQFIESRGLTWEQVRKIPKAQRPAFQADYQDWLRTAMPRKRNAPLKGVAAIGSNMTQAEHGDLTILYSYQTPVAILAPSGGYRTEQQWSKTTSSHIGKFFKLHGYDLRGAAKIPQTDLEAFAMAGEISERRDFPVNVDPTPAEMAEVVRRLTRRRGNPRRKHIEYDERDTGLHVDGALGQEHAMQKVSSMLADIESAQADSLLDEYDEGSSSLEEEHWGEWLDEAMAVLQSVTADGLTWIWDAGDLILTDEEPT